jgi:hypothetical protein
MPALAPSFGRLAAVGLEPGAGDERVGVGTAKVGVARSDVLAPETPAVGAARNASLQQRARRPDRRVKLHYTSGRRSAKRPVDGADDD